MTFIFISYFHFGLFYLTTGTFCSENMKIIIIQTLWQVLVKVEKQVSGHPESKMKPIKPQHVRKNSSHNNGDSILSKPASKNKSFELPAAKSIRTPDLQRHFSRCTFMHTERRPQKHNQRVDSLVHRRLCLYRPQMKSPHRSHHVGWAWLQGWKLCPSPLSSVNWGSCVLLSTRMMPTRLSRSGTLPGLILRALALSRRGGEKGARVSSMRSTSDLRSRSSMNSPRDMAAVTSPFPGLSLTSRKTSIWWDNGAKYLMIAGCWWGWISRIRHHFIKSEVYNHVWHFSSSN